MASRREHAGEVDAHGDGARAALVGLTVGAEESAGVRVFRVDRVRRAELLGPAAVREKVGRLVAMAGGA